MKRVVPLEENAMRKATGKTPETRTKKKNSSTRPRATRGSTKAAAKKNGPEDLDALRKRARRIVRILHEMYPDAATALHHRNPYQLLVATILSAQSTDETVNRVTPKLFAAYPTPRKLATADPADVEKIIHATGFFRQKARSIINACKKIVEDFGGQVPDTMDGLLSLPGVARKTANVVLGSAFGKNEGFVVDTHVGRLAHRLGLTWTSRDPKDAVKIEQDLCQVIPRKEWTFVGHALIWHGRRVCQARKPDCPACRLSELCPSAFMFDKPTPTEASSKRKR